FSRGTRMGRGVGFPGRALTCSGGLTSSAFSRFVVTRPLIITTVSRCPSRGSVVMGFPRLRAPIVLVHGLFGFDRLGVAGWVLANYSPGIAEAMTAAGNRVLIARLSPTAGIAVRAAQLKAQIEQALPSDEPVHILGHSMGGLDSRYLISRLGFDRRVLS